MTDEVGSAMPVFFGMAGASLGIVLSNFGAAYGTARSGVGIAAMGLMAPEAVMKNVLPAVMAGVLGIYGLIVAVLIVSGIPPPNSPDPYTWANGFRHLASGLCIGFSSIGAGYAIGIVGDAGVRAVSQNPKVYVAMILCMIFSEALALYGLIVALILAT